MKLKLFLVLGLLYQTAYGWNLRKPYDQWSQKDKDEYKAAKNSDSVICAAEAKSPTYGYSSSRYEECMKRKGWS